MRPRRRWMRSSSRMRSRRDRFHEDIRAIRQREPESSPMTLYAKNTTTAAEVPVGANVAYKTGGAFVLLPAATYDVSIRSGTTTIATLLAHRVGPGSCLHGFTPWRRDRHVDHRDQPTDSAEQRHSLTLQQEPYRFRKQKVPARAGTFVFCARICSAPGGSSVLPPTARA